MVLISGVSRYHNGYILYEIENIPGHWDERFFIEVIPEEDCFYTESASNYYSLFEPKSEIGAMYRLLTRRELNV